MNALSFNASYHLVRRAAMFGSSVKTPLIIPVVLFNKTMSPMHLKQEVEMANQNRHAISSLELHSISTTDITGFFKATFESLTKYDIPCLEMECSTFNLHPTILREALENALKETRPENVQTVRFINNGWNHSELKVMIDALFQTSIQNINLSGNSAGERQIQELQEMVKEKNIEEWKNAGFNLTKPVRHFIFKPEVEAIQVFDTGC